jgi:hypothetical protein
VLGARTGSDGGMSPSYVDVVIMMCQPPKNGHPRGGTRRRASRRIDHERVNDHAGSACSACGRKGDVTAAARSNKEEDDEGAQRWRRVREALQGKT